MMILRFRVENHRSLRDEVELSLVRPRLKTVVPPDGDWVAATTRVAGIYGANASGKSTVVDAIKFMRFIVARSATSLATRNRLPHQPFLLDSRQSELPSSYSLDFVHEGVRYQYGFQITPEAVTQEWLYDYPHTKHRVLFERENQNYRFGRALVGSPRRHAGATGARELFVSKAAANRHPLLASIRDAFVEGLLVTRFSENDRDRRLERIAEGIAEGDINLTDVITLLKVADIGIANVGIDETEVPEDIRELTEIIYRHLENKASPGDNNDSSESSTSATSRERELVRRALKFQHAGQDGDVSLPLEAQSTGTLSWLSLTLPALEALRSGGVMIVDEIDASLHPHLSHMILRMFKDADYNRTGAQLVFTTHDTFLLSKQADAPLEPEETWFTEKDFEGVTELFSLSDFPTRAEQNFALRYLDGRYGGIPRTARSFLASLLDQDEPEHANA